MSGYVRLHRDLLAHPAFRNDAEALAFAWMFARAAWRDTRVRYKGHAVSLARGQLAVSIRDMAEALDRDKAWIERLFKRLRGETMIETASAAGVSVITICNYDKFQPVSDAGEAARETPGETDARQTRDTEQGREEGKEAKVVARKRASPPPAKPNGFELPAWVPNEAWQAFVDMRRELERGPKKIPFTVGAAKGIIGELTAFHDAGHDISAILMKSAINGYRGVFAPDHPSPGKADAKPLTDADRAKAAAFGEAKRAYDAGEISFDEMMGHKPKPPDEPRRQFTGPKPIGQIVQRIQNAA